MLGAFLDVYKRQLYGPVALLSTCLTADTSLFRPPGLPHETTQELSVPILPEGKNRMVKDYYSGQ